LIAPKARLPVRFRLYTVREFTALSSVVQDTHPGFIVSDPIVESIPKCERISWRISTCHLGDLGCVLTWSPPCVPLMPRLSADTSAVCRRGEIIGSICILQSSTPWMRRTNAALKNRDDLITLRGPLLVTQHTCRVAGCRSDFAHLPRTPGLRAGQGYRASHPTPSSVETVIGCILVNPTEPQRPSSQIAVSDATSCGQAANSVRGRLSDLRLSVYHTSSSWRSRQRSSLR
jgi:hypothetical protein